MKQLEVKFYTNRKYAFMEAGEKILCDLKKLFKNDDGKRSMHLTRYIQQENPGDIVIAIPTVDLLLVKYTDLISS